MRNLNLIKFIHILIMNTIIDNNGFMTIENFKQLIKIFDKFMIDTHGININSENINLKKIMFDIMQKIFQTKYGKELNIKELNKITLKSTRDNIYENHKEIFTSEKKFSTIHRENQIHNNRKIHENINFKEKNPTQLKKEIANNINDNFNKLQDQRNNNSSLPEQIDFEEKVKNTELTQEDINLKMKELEESRNKQDSDIVKNMKNNNEFMTPANLNNSIIPEQKSSNIDPINFNRIPDENERSNLLDNINTHINDNLIDTQNDNQNDNKNNINGFDLNDDFDDYSLSLVDNSNSNYLIDDNQNVINIENKSNEQTMQPQTMQQQIMQPQTMQPQTMQPQTMQPQIMQPQTMQPQEMQQEIHQTILKKIIICSKDRDMKEYPLPNKYKITLEQPIRYVKRIKLVNILINFKKDRKKKNTENNDETENFNYAILKLNNYDVNKSNNENINNSFAFIYPNKVYDEEIFFDNELDILDEINIEILNHNGELLKIKDNHIIELQLEVF